MSHDSIWDLIRAGQYLRAYDESMAAMGVDNDDVELRYLAVLALKRSGATHQARARLEGLGLDSVDLEGLPRRLAEDISALGPSLAKDLTLTRSPGARPEWAEDSARGYDAAFTRHGSAYLAANAATMWLVAEDRARARDAANRALAALRPLDSLEESDRYWEAATEAEAALVLGETGRVESALAVAATWSDRHFASRAITLRQLKLVCELLEIEPEILAPIANPSVVHYCGHRILSEGESGRFPAEDESRVADALRAAFDELSAGFGFGSLAAGADILAAEALLERGAELSVVLPFNQEEFVEVSVAPAGAEWVARFHRCVAAAGRVTTAVSGEYLDDPVLFDFCSQIAMGDALIRARDLESDAHQVAVWDGVPTAGAAGTALDVAHWRGGGHPTEVISVQASGYSSSDRSLRKREIRGVVFGDFAGFSTLSDAQLIVFQEQVMGGLATALEPFRRHILSGRTWGDGVYLVLDEVSAAADCALSIQSKVSSMDFHSLGLETLGSMRVAAHAAPVFGGRDPISGDRLFYGADVTRAARIEPTTPEGEIYVTHSFAALTVLGGAETFQTQYVGTLPTAKGFGDLPLFALHRRASQSGESAV